VPGKLLPRWETDFSGRRVARRHNLSTLMDPKQRISEARDLNNNLMRWRVAEGIDLECIKRGKVAVLGMGTLGCGVVRTLMVLLVPMSWVC
jgi:ubiquitin-like modifier-activating enzyme ATG7